MLICPSCGAAHRDGFTECATCRVPLVEEPAAAPTAPPAEWVSVFRGVGVQARGVQESLTRAGFHVVRLPGESVEVFPIEASRGPELGLHTLAIPRAEHEARREEVKALVGAGGGPGEDRAAALEAEEDYDVRGCPACLLYFHENYQHCPGCGADLLPAVECFEKGQTSPDRVIVGHGTEAGVKELEARLKEAGLDAQASAVEDWPVSVVDVSWQELTDRTAEVETALGLR